jgi:Cu+-exporting ATPase
MPKKVVDPVCGMVIQEDVAAGSAEYDGRTYHFCSPSCQQSFEAEPKKYAENA